MGRQIGVGKESDVFEVLANQSADTQCRSAIRLADLMFAMLSWPDTSASLLIIPSA